MKKVQKLAASLLVAVWILPAGCREAPRTGDDAQHGRFGSPYQIITNRTPTEPDEPPAIVSDSLSVLLAYPGGCADHGFDVHSSISGDSARVWLRHDRGGDDCEALIMDRLTFALPASVLAARRIELLNPEAEVPFILRWDSPANPSGPAD